MISCPSCQCPQINSQLTCRRCGEYLSTQGTVEHPTNALTAVLVLAAVIGGIGYGTYHFMQSQKPPTATKATIDASATAAAPKVDAQKNVKTKKKKRRKR